MPANLSPEYKDADQAYRRATTDDERLEALHEMLRTIPKHKGTEKLQADLKSRIAKLKLEAQRTGGKKKGHDPAAVPREGAGQVVMVGAPNAGKSALVAAVTNARPEVADYPFTTQAPLPGMMRFENTQVQLVDVPPFAAEFTPPWLAHLVRHADVACLVADAGSDECLDGLSFVLDYLEQRQVTLVRERSGPKATFGRTQEVTTVLVAAKMDVPDARDRAEIVRELYANRFDLLPVSAQSGLGLDELRAVLFRRLQVVRVCTKAPGKPPDTERPFVLPQGSTVQDLARLIHKDLADKLQFARIWGQGQYDGQRVPRDHVLADMDVLEIHG
jgi:uncharacterized protein